MTDATYADKMLRRIREVIDVLEPWTDDDTDVSRDDVLRQLPELCTQFRLLDAWLKDNGYLPADWQRARR